MVSKRISTTGVGATAPITVYSNSPENTDLGANFKIVLPGNVVGPMYQASGNLTEEDISSDDDVTVEIVNPDESSSSSDSSTGSAITFTTPSVSDIAIVSNSVVYSDSGIPTATLTLKVKNSSGTILKGINVRIQSV